MDYNKLYEQYAPDYDVISTEYIKDDEEGENSYDRKAMIDFLEFVVSENEDDEYYKELCKVYVAMQRLKDNFYKEMHRNFLNHNVALFECEDESLGESETDLMTMWADDIQTQVMQTVKITTEGESK